MQYTRRQLVKTAAYLVGALSSARLLEACSTSTPAAAPTTAAQPTSPPKPTAAAAPTTGAAPTAAAAATTAPGAPAVTAVTSAAEAAGVVAPKAARGELSPGTIVIAISGGQIGRASCRERGESWGDAGALDRTKV